MATLSDLSSKQGHEQALAGVGANAWFARVVEPAPASANDDLFVDIPEISILGKVKWSCRWNASLLIPPSLPQAGDEVLVIFDNRQQPWVVALWQ